jgi:hypothetical protein
LHTTNQIKEVDHLYSSYLYRRAIADYELTLSPAGFREETLHTYTIKRDGAKVLIDPRAITYHFPGLKGGIRSYPPEFYEQDEKIFQIRLLEWGVRGDPVKICVLDCGKGDHVVFKPLISELKNKYGKLLIASCYPDVFADDDVEQITIEEAKMRYGNLDRWNIYRWGIDHQWTASIQNAFRQMYNL